MDRPLFKDRVDAGRQLATPLRRYGREQPIVLGLPRGGVPVAAGVAAALDAPLDVYLVRKVGVPGHEELAMGAIATGGVVVRNVSVLETLGIAPTAFNQVVARERTELQRRERLYRAGRPALELRGRTVILVDDGLATGATMKVAVASVRQHRPARIIVAVPVASPDSCEAMRADADEVICVATPDPLYGVGRWYEDFSATSDDEVLALLAQRPAPTREAAMEAPT